MGGIKQKFALISTKHCVWKIKHCCNIQHCSRQIQYCRSHASTISNPKSNLKDATCLFYTQTCTIQTLTYCLVVEIGAVQVCPINAMAQTARNTLSQLKHCHACAACKNSTLLPDSRHTYPSCYTCTLTAVL